LTDVAILTRVNRVWNARNLLGRCARS